MNSQPEEASEKVNAWAKEETHGKIKGLLPPGSVDGNTRLVLANALYFKGAWAKPFDSFHTKDGEFFLLDGSSIQVPMMRTSQKQYVKDFATFQALRLPYEAGNDIKNKRLFSMFILLPHEKTGLPALERALNSNSLMEDLKQVDRKVTMERFEMPKFKVSCGFEVPAALKAIGLSLPFGDEADLSDMVESASVGESLCIDNMYHKTFVDVNEQGTEAAASTAMVITTKSLDMEENPTEFVCDHPFLFIIKEEMTNVIIFTGRITNPYVEKASS